MTMDSVSITITPLSAADLASYCSIGESEELTPATIRLHAPDALVRCDSDGRIRARASLWWQRVAEYPGQRLGIIGHYAASDDECAVHLLNAACHELATKGRTLAVGPMDGNTWRHYRFVTERGTEPQFFLEPHNPDAWPRQFELSGFTPLAHYYSSLNDDIRRAWAKQPTAIDGLGIRSLYMNHIDAELDSLWTLASQGFADNFLYTPIEQAEFRNSYRRLLPAIRPDWVLFAEYEGRLVGLCLSTPDLLQRARGVALDTLIVKSLAVAPEFRGQGLGALLTAEVTRRACESGMRRAVHALMHEGNPSQRIGGQLMRKIRTYTLYQHAL